MLAALENQGRHAINMRFHAISCDFVRLLGLSKPRVGTSSRKSGLWIAQASLAPPKGCSWPVLHAGKREFELHRSPSRCEGRLNEKEITLQKRLETWPRIPGRPG